MSEEEKQAIEGLRKNRGVSFAQADIISNLIEKQQEEIENNKQMIDELNFRYNIEHSKNLSKKELINEQQKEIEELKKENFDTVYMKVVADFKDKIRELIEQLEDVLDLAESEKRFPKYRKQAIIEEIRDLQELLEE